MSSKRKQEASNEETDVKKSKSESKTESSSNDWNLKIVSWNVDGLRAWLKKNGKDIFEKEDPDVICLQEIKCSDSKLPDEIKNVSGYHSYFNPSKTEGYSGVALFSKVKPIEVSYKFDADFDDDGRFISAEYEHFYLVTTYVPNSGKKLVTLPKRMDWEPKFRSHLKSLDEKKPVILCGDLNVSHKEIDLKNPKTNKKNAGFTKEERDAFGELLEEGFVDSFRHFYPDKVDQYTFWTYMFNCRAKNVGWRLDYFVVSKRFMPKVSDSVIKNEFMGSDHCPIALLLNV